MELGIAGLANSLVGLKTILERPSGTPAEQKHYRETGDASSQGDTKVAQLYDKVRDLFVNRLSSSVETESEVTTATVAQVGEPVDEQVIISDLLSTMAHYFSEHILNTESGNIIVEYRPDEEEVYIKVQVGVGGAGPDGVTPMMTVSEDAIKLNDFAVALQRKEAKTLQSLVSKLSSAFNDSSYTGFKRLIVDAADALGVDHGIRL